MAMFQKPSHQPAKSLSQTIAHDDVDTVVGPSVKVEGDFASEGNIVVKGIVCGNVQTSKMLTVENGAKIFANVKAGNALVAGGVKGNVRVNERLELTETAQINGDVTCKILEVAAGALIHGKVAMKGAELEDGEARKDEKKQSVLKTKAEAEEKVD